MLLIYGNDPDWESRSEEERNAIFGEYMAIAQAPGVVESQQLQPVETATTVRVENGSTLTTDGPFAETKEVLGGYYLLEAESLDAAVELAARVPAARTGGAVEGRPLVARLRNQGAPPAAAGGRVPSGVDDDLGDLDAVEVDRPLGGLDPLG